jgi:retron-type reverse transcriptase
MESFESIFSFENLFSSWNEFRCGKKLKSDVTEFSSKLISHLTYLHHTIHSGEYKHGGYKHFKISDPKPRDIHKASVADRVLHHALYRSFYRYFDQLFIYDSYSCRINKGAHRAFARFSALARKVSNNHLRTVWVLKCDIKKCFASIDHGILKNLLKKHITCERTLKIVNEVIDSFNLENSHKGIPLGNLTSQLFVNVYLNELDQFIKRKLKVEHYIRYADDFVIMSTDREVLLDMLKDLDTFLKEQLKLSLHPDKVSISTVASGIDFLGWTHFPNHRVLRTNTKKRMMRNLKQNRGKRESIASYLGFLKHGNAYNLSKKIMMGESLC